MRYAAVLAREVWRDWVDRTKDWTTRLIGFFVQSALLFLILYRVPGLGSLHDASHVALAGAISVIGSGFLLLLWSALAAPARLHSHMLAHMKEQHAALTDIADVEGATRMIAAAYEEGMTKYKTILPPDEYKIVMDEWADKTDKMLVSHFSTSDAYRFRSARHRASATFIIFGSEEDWKKQTKDVRESSYGRLKALEDLIKYPPTPLDTDRISAIALQGLRVIRKL